MAITAVGSQEFGGIQNSSATAAQTYPGNITNGNRIVVIAAKGIATHRAFIAGDCAKSSGTATIGAFTLDKTAAKDDTGGASGAWLDVGIWSAPVTGTGSCVITVTGDAGTFWVLAIAEYTSSLGSISVGPTNSATGNSTAPNAGSVTPTLYQGVLIGGLASGQTGNTAITPDVAFTTIHEEEDATAHQAGSAIRQIIAAGSASASWTITSSAWAAAVVAYYEASGSGGGGSTVALEWKQTTSQPTNHYNTSIIMAQSQTPPVVPWLVTKATFVTGTFDWILPTVDLDWTVG